MESPSPVPELFVEKYGSKRCARVSESIPGPVSRTRIRTRGLPSPDGSSTGSAVSVKVPPAVIASSAFSMRFRSARRMSALSTKSGGVPDSTRPYVCSAAFR